MPNGKKCLMEKGKLKSAFSRTLLGATIACNLVAWVLKKISLEMVKNDISLGGASKQNALFSENVP